jgi:hypothetical protein
VTIDCGAIERVSRHCCSRGLLAVACGPLGEEGSPKTVRTSTEARSVVVDTDLASDHLVALSNEIQRVREDEEFTSRAKRLERDLEFLEHLGR